MSVLTSLMITRISILIDQVNDVPLCPMTHEQAVIFLRQASDSVKLRLYRDNAQTPIASMSPTNSESRALCNNNRQKACLRYVFFFFFIKSCYNRANKVSV